MDPTAPGSSVSSLPLLLVLALGLAILHCVVADGNTTRTPETNGSLCGAPGENCTAVRKATLGLGVSEWTCFTSSRTGGRSWWSA
uniref:Betacellulin, epidermal growth factor family member n=1 Tax=Mus musculus TaxID=10090 RepID=A0A0J9YTZ3_MOUSE